MFTVNPIVALDKVGSQPVLFHFSESRDIFAFDLFSGKIIKKWKEIYGPIRCMTWREDAEVMYTKSQQQYNSFSSRNFILLVEIIYLFMRLLKITWTYRILAVK
jgi:hypothetical protein